jgi:hypothetical protein
VREDIRRWYGSHFWAPNALGEKALTDTLHGMYLPFWTFDAHAECPWEAEAGYDYTTTDSPKAIRRPKPAGNMPAAMYRQHFDDLLVPASKGVHAEAAR